MDCIKVRCFQINNDYQANLIDYEEFKRRLKVIDDEIKIKQPSLELKLKEKKP